MPWGLTRFHHSGQSHFVTFCCYHRPIRFLRCAQSLRAGSVCLPRTQAHESSSQPWSACGAVSGFAFYGYVVMPEHVHLVLSEPQWERSSCRTAPLKPKDGLNGPPVHHGNSVLHPSLGVHGGKQSSASMPLVVVGHGPTTPLFPGQARLGAIQRLDLTFFVN